MVAHVETVAFQGIEALPVDVQVHIGAGMPAFTVVGLPDKAVAESRERVRGALAGLGLALPLRRITVNLAPADMQKEGSHFDLPIALSLLVAMEVLAPDDLATYVALGELGLDGALIPVTGVLPAAIGANARERGLICPATNGAEAAWAGGGEVVAPADLLALINHFKGTQMLAPPKSVAFAQSPHYPDLRDIKGQETAKRALELAAAGGHNLLMIGPPGTGKSMLASRLPGILPPLAPEEALSVSMIASVAGLLGDNGLTRSRPFRDPHHSASMAAMVGGGVRARPGEVSLAHLGVLFLDELPEFPRPVLDALRQPIESGAVAVARVNAHVRYPRALPARRRDEPVPLRLPVGPPLAPAPARPAARRTIRCAYRARSTTASTSTWTCRSSPPPTSRCRRLPRVRPRSRPGSRPPARPSGRASTHWARRPTSAPMRRPRASCSPESPRRTRADGSFSRMRPIGSGSRPAATTVCSRLRARSRISPVQRPLHAGISPRRSPTAASAPTDNRPPSAPLRAGRDQALAIMRPRRRPPQM